MFPYYVPPKKILVSINIKQGQYWEYREDTDASWPKIPKDGDLEDKWEAADCIAIVMDVVKTQSFIGPVVETVLMRFVKEHSRCPHSLGEQIEFELSDFTEGHFRMLHDEVRYGAYCGKCGDYFPDAEVKPDFACWACRNGW